MMGKDIKNYMDFWQNNKDLFSMENLQTEYLLYIIVSLFGSVFYSLGMAALASTLSSFTVESRFNIFLGLEALSGGYLLFWLLKNILKGKKQRKINIIKLIDFNKLLKQKEVKDKIFTFLIPYMKEKEDIGVYLTGFMHDHNLNESTGSYVKDSIKQKYLEML